MKNPSGIKNILGVDEQKVENIIRDFLDSMEQMEIVFDYSDFREKDLSEDFILEQYFGTFGHDIKDK